MNITRGELDAAIQAPSFEETLLFEYQFGAVRIGVMKRCFALRGGK